MNIFEKIKQFFKRKEIKALPDKIENNTKDYASEVVLTRDDGTIVTIKPRIDRLGNQMYEQIWSDYENEMKCIPKFLVYSEELKKMSSYKDLYMGTDILIDINPSDLQNPEFAEYLANNVLYKEIMPKIVEEYCSYAGIVEKTLDDEGRVSFDRKMDITIINSLNIIKDEKTKETLEEMQRREQEIKAKIKEEAKNKKVNDKNDHAEDLSRD